MIIGLCGFQGAGKDTVGNILVDSHGFVQLSFASALKDAISVLFQWNREMLNGLTPESRVWRETVDEFWSNKLQIENFTPRKALQMIGTDLFRKHFNSNFWISIVENKINNMIKTNPNVRIVVTDCRFINELQLVKNYQNSQIIHVKRNIPEWFDDFESGKISDINIIQLIHPSEIEWMKWQFDRDISNDKSIEELEYSVLQIINFSKM